MLRELNGSLLYMAVDQDACDNGGARVEGAERERSADIEGIQRINLLYQAPAQIPL